MVLVIRFSVLFFLLLIISGSLLSTSFAAAGGRSKFLISEFSADTDADLAIKEEEEGTANKAGDEEELSITEGRLLRANSRDYGHYDPSPTFSKPPFKRIPN